MPYLFPYTFAGVYMRCPALIGVSIPGIVESLLFEGDLRPETEDPISATKLP
jgi:hypothetical protein